MNNHFIEEQILNLINLSKTVENKEIIPQISWALTNYMNFILKKEAIEIVRNLLLNNELDLIQKTNVLNKLVEVLSINVEDNMDD